MNVCKRVLYQGHVQGVGFRYTAYGLAHRFTVAGYVKNLPDGSVELAVEGESGEVDRFLEAVARQLAEHIQSREEHDQPAQGFARFEIRM